LLVTTFFPVASLAGESDALRVSEDRVLLHAVPGASSETLKTLLYGDPLILVSDKMPWIQVETQDHHRGWIRNDQAVRTSYWKARTATSYHTSLSDLGYRDGLTIDNAETTQHNTFYFRLPRDTTTQAATLQLNYLANGLTDRHARIRVDINDRPRSSIKLDNNNQPRSADIHLTNDETAPGLVKVTLRTTLASSANRCLDARTSSAFVHILPDSALSFKLAAPVDSIRDYWLELPTRVRISLPGETMSAEQFAAAWQLGDQLRRGGKTVTFVSLPELGDLVVASADALKTDLARHYAVPGELPMAMGAALTQQSESGDNVLLMSAHHDRFLWVAPPYSLYGERAILPQWQELAGGKSYRIQAGQPSAAGSPARYRVNLGDLGMDLSTRYLHQQGEWTLALDAGRLQPGYIPEMLKLAVISPPSNSGHPTMLYAFLNDVLQQVFRLDNSGMRQTFNFSMQPHALQHNNKIRIVVQRAQLTAATEMDCLGAPATLPTQLLPESELIAIKQKGQPQHMEDLANYLADGFTVYVADSYRSHAEEVLQFLARLSADMNLPAQDNVVFVDSNEELIPKGPFIMIGDARLDPGYAPLRFDLGRIQILDKNQHVLLDVKTPPDFMVAQVVDAGAGHGLWVIPDSDGHFYPLPISRDNLLLVDHSGVLFGMDSRKFDTVKVSYSDLVSWDVLLGKYRYWIMVIAWITLVVVLLYLYRIVRRHSA
jgi:hypothetical protein